MKIQKHSFDLAKISDECFLDYALSIFRKQAQENPIYKQFIEYLKINPLTIHQLEMIPFLPVQFFKSHIISCGNEKIEKIFKSSGTGTNNRSQHYVSDLKIYETSFQLGFKHFYGNIEDYAVLAILPSYLEQGDSSLIYMVGQLIASSKHPHSAYYSKDESIEAIMDVLTKKNPKQKILLIGVTYALLDLAEQFPLSKPHNNLIVMDTGGMKGRKKEMIRQELHALLKIGFKVNQIHSEYSMTELMSQAYSSSNGAFICPPWMKVLFRDLSDPFEMKDSGGGINIIDLANINTCSFIETQDIGKKVAVNSFEVLGRMDNSDKRGCSQLYL